MIKRNLAAVPDDSQKAKPTIGKHRVLISDNTGNESDALTPIHS